MGAIHRVLIVEDDAEVRARLVRAIEASATFEVMAACGSMHAARTALGRRLPSIALIDLGLPDGNGTDLVAWLCAQPVPVECLVLTLFADERHVVEAIRAGASGYLLKSEATDRIGDALGRVLAGESPISPAVARFVLRLARGHGEESRPAAEAPRLTPTEFEILGLIAKGFTAREIADLTERSPATVPGHVRNIYRKLAVHSRGEAIFEATQLGLLRGSER
ncbi:MAG: response regulator transcription factor [Burkholderiaceae bacterium]